MKRGNIYVSDRDLFTKCETYMKCHNNHDLFRPVPWWSKKLSHHNDRELFLAMYWLRLKPSQDNDHDLSRATHSSSMKPSHHNNLYLFRAMHWSSMKPAHNSNLYLFRAMRWSSMKPSRRPRVLWITWMAQNCWVKKWLWIGVSSEGLVRPSQCDSPLLVYVSCNYTASACLKNEF